MSIGTFTDVNYDHDYDVFPPVARKARKKDQVAILAAVAARDSGCHEVHRKWENHRKLNGKRGIHCCPRRDFAQRQHPEEASL